jgi:XRE family transcriptional regulator, regulator of sulfur utilization
MKTQPHTDPIHYRRRPGASRADSLSAIVAERLKRFLGRENRSLERLTELTGIETVELQRIESGAEAPTIGRLWRIANALGVPFGSLVAAKERQGVRVIRKNALQAIASSNGRFVSRPLFPLDCSHPAEFYEITIGPSHIERAEAHAPGTKENILIGKGSIEIIVGKEPAVQLDEGDAIDFLADVPHSYRNLGVVPSVIYLVMSYERTSDPTCA